MQQQQQQPHVFRNFVQKIKPAINLFGIYVAWISLHYFAAHLYTTFCVPLTYIGFITSPFVVPTPHCQAFRWVISNGSTHINAMWMAFGTWWVRKLWMELAHASCCFVVEPELVFEKDSGGGGGGGGGRASSSDHHHHGPSSSSSPNGVVL